MYGIGDHYAQIMSVQKETRILAANLRGNRLTGKGAEAVLSKLHRCGRRARPCAAPHAVAAAHRCIVALAATSCGWT